MSALFATNSLARSLLVGRFIVFVLFSSADAQSTDGTEFFMNDTTENSNFSSSSSSSTSSSSIAHFNESNTTSGSGGGGSGSGDGSIVMLSSQGVDGLLSLTTPLALPLKDEIANASGAQIVSSVSDTVSSVTQATIIRNVSGPDQVTTMSSARNVSATLDQQQYQSTASVAEDVTASSVSSTTKSTFRPCKSPLLS